MATKKTETPKNIEKEYTIPLREKCRPVPRYKKTPKAVKTIKEFLVRHMKIYDRDLKKIKLDIYLNEFLWFRGIKKPPAKVKVKVRKEGDLVKVELAEIPTKLKFKKLRHEKIEKQSLESLEKKKESKKSIMEKAKDTLQKPKESETDSLVPRSEKTEEEKKQESEKIKAVAEAGMKRGKEAAKKVKHQAGGKTKQPKRPVRKALAK